MYRWRKENLTLCDLIAKMNLFIDRTASQQEQITEFTTQASSTSHLFKSDSFSPPRSKSQISLADSAASKGDAWEDEISESGSDISISQRAVERKEKERKLKQGRLLLVSLLENVITIRVIFINNRLPTSLFNLVLYAV